MLENTFLCELLRQEFTTALQQMYWYKIYQTKRHKIGQ